MNEYPVVTITGPRQTGKTTLVKQSFPNYSYINLENPEVRKFAESDPNAFFKTYSPPLIIDEIQRVPELLSYIQIIVDKENQNGMFLITGSHQLLLNQSVSQSLAGRTALLHLLPFSFDELKGFNLDYNRDQQIYSGFMPRIYDKNQSPFKSNRNYFQTYIERDVKQLINVKNLVAFEDFMRLLAGRTGQIVNIHSMANDLGISSPTLLQWMSILEASYIIFRLRPYYENFGKRIIKSPKIYFTDVGLVSYLLGIENPEQVSRDPLLGGLFENMVVMEAVKARLNKGLDPNLYFFRDNNGNEIDLIFKKHNCLYPIEIKASMTYNERLTKSIRFFRKINNKPEKGYLIYAGDLSINNDAFRTIHFTQTSSIFD